jgi:hypothetical protein
MVMGRVAYFARIWMEVEVWMSRRRRRGGGDKEGP